MHVHRIAEVADNPLRAQAAGLLFVGIAPFYMQQLLVPHGHAPSANPVFAVPGVNVIEIGQRDLECDNSQNIRSLASRILELID
jgi:hypothetical protein